MIPRYSLYIDPSEINGYVREDMQGKWVKWADAMDYEAYALAHGFNPPVAETETTPRLRLAMAEDILPEDIDIDDLDDVTPDDGVDVYDFITNRHDPIEL